MKWYEKLIYAFFIILMSPLLLLTLICYLILLPFIAINKRIVYKKSAYYRDFKCPFNNHIYGSNGYTFYNYIMEEGLPIQYIKQKNASLDYFIYENQAFIFPDFSEIKYNEEKQYWEVIYRHLKKESCCTLEEYLDKKMSLFEESINLPLRLLVSRNYFKEGYIDLAKLPKCLHIVRNYTSFFKDEDKDSLSMIPQTTKDLYEMMLKNKKLGGKFKLVNEEFIVWTFDKVIYEIAMSEEDGYFSVTKNSKFKLEITHWHPDNYEVYEEVCNIGEKGNILVIKSFLGGAKVLYMGPKEKCRINKKKIHLGKIYYFESNDVND